MSAIPVHVPQRAPDLARKETRMSLSNLEIVTLSLLTTADRTGYDIRKWLDQYGYFVGYNAKTSQIYRQLGTIEERSWATSRPDPRSNGPDAKLYSITNAGRAALQAWIDSPYVPAPRPLDPDFQVRLLFGAPTPEKALELVRSELAFRREQESVRVPSDDTLVRPDASAQERRWAEEWSQIRYERGHYMIRALLAWLEAAEMRLEVIAGRQ